MVESNVQGLSSAVVDYYIGVRFPNAHSQVMVGCWTRERFIDLPQEIPATEKWNQLALGATRKGNTTSVTVRWEETLAELS